MRADRPTPCRQLLRCRAGGGSVRFTAQFARPTAHPPAARCRSRRFRRILDADMASTAADARLIDSLAQARRPGLLQRLRLYGRPLAALTIAAPLTAFAILLSLTWVGVTFPGFFVMSNGVVPTVSGYAWPPDKSVPPS